MKAMLRPAVAIQVLVLLVGCVAQRGPSLGVADFYETKAFTAPLAQELAVDTGDALFVEGRYIQGEYVEVPDPIDMMVPGSMRIPFPVHIDAGKLRLSRIKSGWKYYSAEEGKMAASFPGLGSVLRKGDEVGIRISAKRLKRQWYVDNSNYNGMRTIWTKNLDASESGRYSPHASPVPFKIDRLRRIVFDGYYGNQLHFTWEEVSAGHRESREFTFDFSGKPTVVGVKGNEFKVISADNVGLRYEWVRFR
ncbi:MAG: hypothetical protein HN341_11255 [Verrucomicrobia bacterium]|jgi:hypothetical protein|nr:hypothetical protein [Verrucomicrobiota bacterium]